jgi:hypothetical protein
MLPELRSHAGWLLLRLSKVAEHTHLWHTKPLAISHWQWQNKQKKLSPKKHIF